MKTFPTSDVKTGDWKFETGSRPASTILCDFDGTITVEDTIDQLLAEHAAPEWRAIETLWEEGLIGSRECLKQQIACIGHFTPVDFESFVHRVKIDMSFIPFISFVQAQRIPLYIISDGFDLIIRSVLEKHEVRGVPIFCNQMAHTQNRLSVSFPLSNPGCESKCGLCKSHVMKKVTAAAPVIYIGDGRSDLCASRNASTVFAKGRLATYCQDEGRDFVPFENFEDVMCKITGRKEHAEEQRYAI